MFSDEASAPPPYSAYAVTYQSAGDLLSDSAGRPQLLQNVLEARTTHLKFILHSIILPPVEQRALVGLSHTQLALIPFCATTTSPTNIPPSVAVGFLSFSNSDDVDPIPTREAYTTHDENEVIQIRLQSPVDTPGFWSQSSVLDELERLLKAELAKIPTKTVPKPVTKGKEVRNRVDKTAGQVWRGKNRAENNHDCIRIKVEADEICLRTVNSFGLYEILRKDAVMIDIALGQ